MLKRITDPEEALLLLDAGLLWRNPRVIDQKGGNTTGWRQCTGEVDTLFRKYLHLWCNEGDVGIMTEE